VTGFKKKNQIRLVKNALSSRAYFLFKEVEAIDRFRIVSTAPEMAKYGYYYNKNYDESLSLRNHPLLLANTIEDWKA
jgi:hypothetical protein